MLLTAGRPKYVYKDIDSEEIATESSSEEIATETSSEEIATETSSEEFVTVTILWPRELA